MSTIESHLELEWEVTSMDCQEALGCNAREGLEIHNVCHPLFCIFSGHVSIHEYPIQY